MDLDTYLIELTDSKAYRLLQDLEDMQIIKVLKKSMKSKNRLSEKYAGKLPSHIADELQDYVTQNRKE